VSSVIRVIKRPAQGYFGTNKGEEVGGDKRASEAFDAVSSTEIQLRRHAIFPESHSRDIN
jgi:hypothetical protein